jgi:transcriptional regulator GlxA family with amidase domain
MSTSEGWTALLPLHAVPSVDAMATHDVVFVAHPRALGVELMGAMDVLRMANQVLEEGGRPPYYRIHLTSVDGGEMPLWGGVRLTGIGRVGEYEGPIDTLVVTGGHHAHEAAQDADLVAAVERAAAGAGRVVGLCTGAFILGAAGLLDGRRATTHWLFGELLAERFPEVKVDIDPIFIADGATWTSAGITASLDLMLAVVEEDLGPDTARMIARALVVFLYRTGNQAQFSAQLSAQLAERHPIRELQSYIAEHPDADLSLTRLAARVQMSPRHFARVFQAEVGMSPGRYVERVRLETARRQLESSDLSVEQIAAASGFGSAETLRRVFHQRLSVSPAEYRRTFGSGNRRRCDALVLMPPVA